VVRQGLESPGGSRASMRCQFSIIDAPVEYELQPGESSGSLHLS
jgi:hypothetical protein